MTFGEWIIEILDKHTNKTQYRLEIDCNLGKGSIWRWSGNHSPRLDSFLRVIDELSKYTGKTKEQLLLDALLNIKR